MKLTERWRLAQILHDLTAQEAVKALTPPERLATYVHCSQQYYNRCVARVAHFRPVRRPENGTGLNQPVRGCGRSTGR